MSESVDLAYEAAAQWTPARVALRAIGGIPEGYWLSENRYFFTRTFPDRENGTLRRVPLLARWDGGSVCEVLSRAELLKILRGSDLDLSAIDGADYQMPDERTLVITVLSMMAVIDIEEARVLHSGDAPSASGSFSPDRKRLIEVDGPNLTVRSVDDVNAFPLTESGEWGHAFGRASEAGLASVARHPRPAPVGFWSSDCRWFITQQVDDRPLRRLHIVEHGSTDLSAPKLHEFKYSFPNGPIPNAVLHAFDVVSGKRVAFEDFPVPLVSPWVHQLDAWLGDGETLWLLRYDRYFKTVELDRLNLADGSGRCVIRQEVIEGYIDLNHDMAGTPNVRILGRTNRIIWFSEETGWGHLYLHDATTGERLNAITQGEWLVRDIVHVDEDNGVVYFLAGGLDPVDPARRALCTVRLDGGEFEKIFAFDGDVSAPRRAPYPAVHTDRWRSRYEGCTVSPGGSLCVLRLASITAGNEYRIVDLKEPGRRELSLASVEPELGEPLPRPFTATAADGETVIHGLLYLPSHFSDRESYPVVDYIYPGPQTQFKPQAFLSVRAAAAQSIAELGFAVIQLDTRGTPGRSRNFHQCGYPDMLEPQLADHAAAVHELCAAHGFLDMDRIGIMGVSAGGAATARALLRYGDIFKVGMSVCGGHDSTHLVAGWSDKYSGPWSEERQQAHANHSFVEGIIGRLLLVSGGIDETVPVSQTLSLAAALIRANKDFDLLIAPEEGHGVFSLAYVQRRCWDYLVEHLQGLRPPRQFPLQFSSMEQSALAVVGAHEWC